MMPLGRALASLAALAALAGCDHAPTASAADEVPVASASPATPVPALPAAPPLPEGFAPLAFDLAETAWLVVAIDGKPLADTYADVATIQFTDAMLIWHACNHHEGLYVPVGGSFAAGPAMATLAACAPSTPDAAIARIIGARPLVARNAEGKVLLLAGGHSLTLSQIDRTARNMPAPPVEAGPFRLMWDGGGSAAPVLSFRGNAFAVWMDCAGAITGKAHVRGGRMMTGDVAVDPACRSHRGTAARALADFLAASPMMARGPNGEVMLSDGEAVVVGRQCHPDASPCAHARPARDPAGPTTGKSALRNSARGNRGRRPLATPSARLIFQG